MRLATRWTITALISVAYGAALTALISGTDQTASLSIAGAMLLTAAALLAINWVWKDLNKKDKNDINK